MSRDIVSRILIFQQLLYLRSLKWMYLKCHKVIVLCQSLFIQVSHFAILISPSSRKMIAKQNFNTYPFKKIKRNSYDIKCDLVLQFAYVYAILSNTG